MRSRRFTGAGSSTVRLAVVLSLVGGAVACLHSESATKEDGKPRQAASAEGKLLQCKQGVRPDGGVIRLHPGEFKPGTACFGKGEQVKFEAHCKADTTVVTFSQDGGVHSPFEDGGWEVTVPRGQSVSRDISHNASGFYAMDSDCDPADGGSSGGPDVEPLNGTLEVGTSTGHTPE